MQSCVCFVDIVRVLIALHSIVEVESYVLEKLLSGCAEAMPRSQLGEYPNLNHSFRVHVKLFVKSLVKNVA